MAITTELPHCAKLVTAATHHGVVAAADIGATISAGPRRVTIVTRAADAETAR
jgi:hypothetical protein